MNNCLNFRNSILGLSASYPLGGLASLEPEISLKYFIKFFELMIFFNPAPLQSISCRIFFNVSGAGSQIPPPIMDRPGWIWIYNGHFLFSGPLSIMELKKVL